jgi:hypothetical protein
MLKTNSCKVCIETALSWSVEDYKSRECKECTKISQETPKSSKLFRGAQRKVPEVQISSLGQAQEG